MRELLGTTCLLIAGCFGPQIASGAFRCEPHDDPPCPTGFSCVGNLCVSDGGPVVDAAGAVEDLTVAPGDLLRPDLRAPFDLLLPPPDLATPRDLASPPDLATGMCGHAGAPCTSIADCCSMYCRTDGICIGG